MAKCYIFAIGGSGARILESFTHLIAAGCAKGQLAEDWEFEPILIDLDKTNGNTLRTIETLQLYKKLSDDLSNSTGRSPYFKHAIKQDLLTGADFMLNLHADGNNTLADSIDLTQLSDPKDRQLISLLYSREVRDMKLDKGFKGVPSIGNLVLNQFSTDPVFDSFVKQFQSGDRIFVIGSIFGGTGAAGLPLLLKNIRSQAGTIKDAPIGVLTVMPYYQIKGDDGSMINSDSFITKTKAALSYYEENLTESNHTYYVGADSTATFDNEEGGKEQNNNPLAAEVLAATSIFNFLEATDDKFTKFSDPEFKNDREFFVCGYQDKGGIIDLDCLDGQLKGWLKRPLVSYYYSMLLGYFVGVNFMNQKRVKIHSIKFKPGFEKSDFIKNFVKYQEFFMAWLHKLNNSEGGKPKFIPFETGADLSIVDDWDKNKRLPFLIKDIEITKKGFLGSVPERIKGSLNHIDGRVTGLAGNDMHLFSEASFLVSDTFINKWKHIN